MKRIFIEVPLFTKKWFALGFTDEDLAELQQFLISKPDAGVIMVGTGGRNMNEFYEELMAGLNEAVAIERGELKGKKTVYEIQPVKKYTDNEIRRIRNSVGMTQVLFADYMGVSSKTVEAWESGKNHPTGTACRLISMLEDKTFETLPFIRKTAAL